MENWEKIYNVNEEDIKIRRRKTEYNDEETLEDYWRPEKNKG